MQIKLAPDCFYRRHLWCVWNPGNLSITRTLGINSNRYLSYIYIPFHPLSEYYSNQLSLKVVRPMLTLARHLVTFVCDFRYIDGGHPLFYLSEEITFMNERLKISVARPHLSINPFSGRVGAWCMVWRFGTCGVFDDLLIECVYILYWICSRSEPALSQCLSLQTRISPIICVGKTANLIWNHF